MDDYEQATRRRFHEKLHRARGEALDYLRSVVNNASLEVDTRVLAASALMTDAAIDSATETLFIEEGDDGQLKIKRPHRAE